jgi:hypothetical protein
MKHTLIFFIILFTSYSYAQRFYWSNPEPLTDSISNNVNCTILNSLHGDLDSTYMFWESYLDSFSTAIYFRNLTSRSEARPILSQENIHFTNPQVTQYGNMDTLLYLFYECDLNGNSDIYYLKYLIDGTFTTPIPFTATPGNEENLRISGSSLVWAENGKIIYSPLQYKPTKIDSSQCSKPAILESDYIVWEKNMGDSSRIFYSQWDEQSQNWSAPVKLYDKGLNTESSFPEGDRSVALLCWQNTLGDNTRIYLYDFYESKLDSVDFLNNKNKYEPSTLYVPQPAKLFVPLWETVISFIVESSPTNQVYANEDLLYSNSFRNVSNNNNINRNPRLFDKGFYNHNQNIINVWESYHNNHWQLFMSNMGVYISAINDNKNVSPADIDLDQNYPNPFNQTTLIKYYLPSSKLVRLKIYSILGEEIKNLIDEQQESGSHLIFWDGTDNKGGVVASGLYIYKLIVDNDYKTRTMLFIK